MGKTKGGKEDEDGGDGRCCFHIVGGFYGGLDLRLGGVYTIDKVSDRCVVLYDFDTTTDDLAAGLVVEFHKGAVTQPFISLLILEGSGGDDRSENLLSGSGR